mmetsp:Transcript_7536/g.20617  ORF Transcript_7536/g.20617 Transcript_7536/m.20617 type:complete len:138 (-) Transcript_7536:355-768(-)
MSWVSEFWDTHVCGCQERGGASTVQEIEHGARTPVLEEIEEPTVKQRMLVTFETRSGKLKHVSVTQRPMGLKYTKTVPLTVVEVGKGSHASDLGIKHGWKVRLVNHEDMTGKSSEQVYRSLVARVAELPVVLLPPSS